ncbi:hypothetical protein KR044_009422, partial [Drosophila immigrans]
ITTTSRTTSYSNSNNNNNNNSFANGHTMGPHKMCYKMQNGFCGFNSNCDCDADCGVE